MPLTRSNVTIASRVMLPTHALFSAGVGATWVLQNSARTNTKALHVLNQWPIAGTGAILLILGAAILLGILAHKRPLAAVALGAGMLVYLFLAATFLISSFEAHASYSAAIWPTYVALGHLASMLSLANDEVTDVGGNHRRNPT